jgi:hypothetical protein
VVEIVVVHAPAVAAVAVAVVREEQMAARAIGAVGIRAVRHERAEDQRVAGLKLDRHRFEALDD